MILLDTHIWVWWVSNDPQLSDDDRFLIENASLDGLALSVISVWEVAKKAERGKLELDRPIAEWVAEATSAPGLEVAPITVEAAVLSTRLPGSFHRDPADQIIVATSIAQGLPLLTRDARIRGYPHVRLAG